MNTPSHLIINAALHKRFRRVPIQRSAFLLGAVLPDLPLFALAIGGYIYYRYVAELETVNIMSEMFDNLYFNNPFWIASHNLFHSPTLLLIQIGLLWRFRQRINSPLRWWFWLCVGCLVHTALDIPTHVNDGPLLFFPFEWSTRFQSPISYWDENYFGREFTIFEMSLNVVLLLYLFGPGLWRRLTGRSRKVVTPEVE
jgi:membrane-bound metal-dependent hydrolase YbcI (DUF457 family)